MAPKKKSQKSKPKSTSNAVVVATPVDPRHQRVMQNLDSDEGQNWNYVVTVLAEHFELPDLTTRKGLRRIHDKFSAVYKKLDDAYKAAERDNGSAASIRLRGGIVGIYAKMCSDVILRDKLFQAGILARLTPLLDIPECQRLALRSLATMTHHGGVDARTKIAKETGSLVKLMRSHPDDMTIQELCVVVISHSAGAVVYNHEDYHRDETRGGKQLATIMNVPEMLDTILDAIRQPTSSMYLITHAQELMALATYNCSEYFRKNKSATNFLVAWLRSQDLSMRCSALGGLIRLHGANAEPDQMQQDPHKIMAAVQSKKWPPAVEEVLMNYGAHRGNIFVQLQTMRDYQKAMMDVVQTHDMYALGMKLAEFILRTEFSIGEGMWETEDPKTGKRVKGGSNLGLPFTMWSDALPLCAKAVRERAPPAEAYMGDILALKFLVMRGRVPEAVKQAQDALARAPDVAYFYYIVTLAADHVLGLRHAKKGLQCARGLTPFVRYALLHRGVDHAADMGLVALQEAQPGDVRWEEGLAFLMSAWEDAKTFMEEAQPDARHMKNVINWYILLTLAIKGPEMSEDLSDLKRASKMVGISEEVSTFLGVKPPNTQMRLARTTVVSHYSEAAREWAAAVARFDSDHGSTNETAEEELDRGKQKADDDLAAWLDELELEDGAEAPHGHGHGKGGKCDTVTHPKISMNTVALYRCSFCGNPSAALKKCSACGKTRYCDGGCQKQHWKAHKKECQKSG